MFSFRSLITLKTFWSLLLRKAENRVPYWLHISWRCFLIESDSESLLRKYDIRQAVNCLNLLVCCGSRTGL